MAGNYDFSNWMAPLAPATGLSLDSASLIQNNPTDTWGSMLNWGNPAPTSSNWLQDIGFLGNKNGQGWGGTALGILGGLGNLYMGMQNYGLAKDTLDHNKDVFNKNYAAQRTTTNAALEDRQRARVANNPNAYESVAAYMDKNRIN